MDEKEVRQLIEDGRKGIPASVKWLVPWIQNSLDLCNIARDREDFFRLADKSSFTTKITNDGVSARDSNTDFVTEIYFWGKQDYVISVAGQLLYSGFAAILSQKGINIKDNHECEGTVLATELQQQLEKALGLERK